MKHLKTFSLVTLAAVLVALAVAGSASATFITGEGGKVLGVGTASKSNSQGSIAFDPPFGTIECSESTIAGKSTSAGGSSETVKGNVETLTFTGCNATVTVLATGTTEVHTRTEKADNNGLVTTSGAKITMEFIGTHCIYETNNTTLGTETGSTNTGGASVIDIEATIPRTGGRSGAFCGTTAQMTGSYKNTTPVFVNVD
jgi:hypothetical protein